MAESKTEQIKEQSRYLRGTIAETLRSDASDEAIQEYLKSVVLQKESRHHIGSPREIPNGVEEANQPSRFISRGEPEFVQPERSMSCIGG